MSGVGARRAFCSLPARKSAALQVMAAYETWFAGRPELAILRILGLFDRPARRELVDVLRKPPVIAGLNNELVDLSENEWRWALARLRQACLIEDEAGGAIDAHPLVREHFGARLKAERPEAWRAGHGRLYERLRDSAKEYPDTLAEMAPLFQAMHHGCQAGRHQEALSEVYWVRITEQANSTARASSARSAQIWRRFQVCSIRPSKAGGDADRDRSGLRLESSRVSSARARTAAGGSRADAGGARAGCRARGLGERGARRHEPFLAASDAR